MKKHTCLWRQIAVGLAFASAASGLRADLVNDDTDVFLTNPTNTTQLPNVLLIVDNTANWNTAFADEKSALVNTVNGLDQKYKVGIGMFAQSPVTQGNAADGAFIRFAVRQMNDTNRSALSAMLGNFRNETLAQGGDKGNNAVPSLAMTEAYRYFGKLASRTTYQQERGDIAGNSLHNSAATLGSNALTASPSSSTLYNSPVTDTCQKNFIIYISNGPANENQDASSAALTELTNARGSAPGTIGLSVSSQQDNWSDEWADFLANTGVPYAGGRATVSTYTVEVNPSITGQGPGMTALLQSMAERGKGKYFAVSNQGGGSQIAEALKSIFSEINAVNSVFAATTLPVSVNVRGTNLNQVYIGVFRPDDKLKPRWFGNLKLYKLALNASTGSVFLADAQGAAAENDQTGFITPAATSYWSSATLEPLDFWLYRDAVTNGQGGATDAPDGDLVEKGGAAQQLRHYYSYDSSTSSPVRELYTCTTDCNRCAIQAGASASTKTCTTPTALSVSPFAVSNADITPAALNLSGVSVGSLSGLEKKTLSALTDRLPVTLNNGAAPVNITAISNGLTTSVALARLSTDKTVRIARIVPKTSGSVISLTAVSRGNGSASNQITLTTNVLASSPAPFAAGQYVLLTGVSCGGASCMTNRYSVSTVGQTGGGTKYHQFTVIDASALGALTVSSATARRLANAGTATLAASETSNPFLTVSGSRSITFDVPSGGFTCTGSRPMTFAGETTIDFECASPPESVDSNGITATGPTQDVVATTSVDHFFSVGDQITIAVAGTTPTAYANGNAAVTLTSASESTFAYKLATGLPGPASASPVGSALKSAGTADVTVKAPGHNLAVDSVVTISNVAGDPGFNGDFIVRSADTTAGTFTYRTSTTLPAPALPSAPVFATASAGTQATVTATVTTAAPHGCPASVIISGATPTAFNGSWSTIDCPTASSIRFSTVSALGVPSGAITMAAGDQHRAYATLAGHAYTTGTLVTIQGAIPTAFNATDVAMTRLDSDHFSYVVSSTSTLQGDASGTVTSGVKSNTARGFAVNHGLTMTTPGTSNRATISGATPAAFNGAYNMTVLDANNFTYTLIGSPQGEASGTIGLLPVSGSGGINRENVINWVRGQDTWEDENSGPGTDPTAAVRRQDVRASVHGDVLHSRPVVINYNRYGGDNDVYVFYGSNDGVFHALKGGTGTDSSDTNGKTPGQEVWGFVPSEFFPTLKRLYNNSPTISANNQKPYFADGPVSAYIKNDDDRISAGGTDAVYLYISMRRGGSYLYSLDVTDPLTPKFRWKITPDTSGFSELGETWSHPTVISQGLPGWTNPVLVFGAGYDKDPEDTPPDLVTASTSTGVTMTTGPSTTGTRLRSRGRGVFIVDAITGELIKSFGPAQGMNWAVPSDVTIVRPATGSKPTRGYVGDTGGNLWRIDFGNVNPANWTVTKIASIATDTAGERRKFMQAPDIVDGSACGTSGDLLLVGTGDREHPFDTTNANRFYMFREKGNDSAPLTGTGADGTANDTIVEADLFDVTNNCLQEVSGCASGQTQATAKTALEAARGWKLRLGSGEKVVSTAVTLNGVVFFNAYSPYTPGNTNQCGNGLGTALLYQVGICSAAAVVDRNSSGSLTAGDRSQSEAGRGYIPPPVSATVELQKDGKGQVHNVVISGTTVEQPPGVSLNSRTRRYWYKEID